MKSCVPLILLFAVCLASAQDPVTPAPLPSAPAIPPPGDPGASGEVAQSDPLAGYLQLKQEALAAWKAGQGKINAQIGQTCNSDRITYLVGQLQAQRAPYDAANRKYWEQWKKLSEAGLRRIATDDDDSSQVDDFKKDLDRQQQDLTDKRAERADAATRLQALIAAKDSPASKDKAGIDANIAALQDLVSAADDLIKQKESTLSQTQALVEAATNKKNGKEYVSKTWKYLLETADEYVKGADVEANLAKQSNDLYGQNRISACMRASGPAGIGRPDPTPRQ